MPSWRFWRRGSSYKTMPTLAAPMEDIPPPYYGMVLTTSQVQKEQAPQEQEVLAPVRRVVVERSGSIAEFVNAHECLKKEKAQLQKQVEELSKKIEDAKAQTATDFKVICLLKDQVGKLESQIHKEREKVYRRDLACRDYIEIIHEERRNRSRNERVGKWLIDACSYDYGYASTYMLTYKV